MKNRLVTYLVGAALLFVAFPLSATPVPVYNECPHTGQGLGCSYLVVFGTHGSVNILSDQNAKDVDGHEGVLVGFQNKSGSYINLADYKGPNNIFSGIHLEGGLRDGKSTYIVTKDSFELDDGKDKDEDDHDYEGDDGPKHVTPEPGSLALLGTGLLAMGGILRRRLRA